MLELFISVLLAAYFVPLVFSLTYVSTKLPSFKGNEKAILRATLIAILPVINAIALINLLEDE